MPVVEDDPFGKIKPATKVDPVKPADVNKFHKNSDADTSPLAQHHTLGPGANQSSPGDHIHDGKRSKLIGQGMGLTVTLSSGTADAKIAALVTQLKKVMDIATT